MEKIDPRYRALMLSQEAFIRALKLFQSKFERAETAEREAYLASIIKHFELLYEMLWKFLKSYLMQVYGIETTGSKTIFRACHAQGLINEGTLALLLEMVEIRNMTTHVYDEQTAIKISQTIMKYYEPIEILIKKIPRPVT